MRDIAKNMPRLRHLLLCTLLLFALLGSFQGEPQLVEVQQNVSDVNRDTKGNILRGAINPVAGVKASIELDDAHAKIQSHAAIPSLYMNVETDPAAPQQPDQAQQPS